MLTKKRKHKGVEKNLQQRRSSMTHQAVAEESFKFKCNICKRGCETGNTVDRHQNERTGEHKRLKKNFNTYKRIKVKTMKKNLRKKACP